MRRAYVVVGENPDTWRVEDYYGVCHSMKRADELCLEAETDNPDDHYTWYEIVEEDDE